MMNWYFRELAVGEKTRDHAGDEMNEQCDLLARNELAKLRQKFPPEQLKVFLEDFKRSLDPADLNGELVESRKP